MNREPGGVSAPATVVGFAIVVGAGVALDRPDVLLSGDLELRRAVQHTYGFDHLPTEDEKGT